MRHEDEVSVTEAARISGVSPATLRRWAADKKGGIDARMVGKRWIIDRTTLPKRPIVAYEPPDEGHVTLVVRIPDQGTYVLEGVPRDVKVDYRVDYDSYSPDGTHIERVPFRKIGSVSVEWDTKFARGAWVPKESISEQPA